MLNATGVLLHTNLGRAPLSAAARDALGAWPPGTCDVELDLATGGRGPARAAARSPRCSPRCPAPAAAHVVNNGAAALVLVATRAGRRAGRS